MSNVTLAQPARGSAIASWIIAGLLLVAFLATGFAHLTTQPMMVAAFASFGFPTWSMYLIGTVEVIGALLVIVPKTARLGALVLACITVGALTVHLTHGQFAMTALPFVLLLLSLALLRLRGGFSSPLISDNA